MPKGGHGLCSPGEAGSGRAAIIVKEKSFETASDKERLPLRRPSWNLWQALMLIAVVSLIEWPLGLLNTPQDLTAVAGIVHFAAVDIMDGVLYAGALVFLFRRLHRPLRDLGFVRPKAAYVLWGLVVGVLLFLIIGLIGTILTRWAGTPVPQSFAVAAQSAKYPWEFYLLLLLGGIIAPLKEETIFRGLFYPPLRQDYGRGQAMIFTAALFAVLHLDLVRFLPLFLGGLVLVWLFEKTESLWPSILAHGTWNILMALALWLQR